MPKLFQKKKNKSSIQVDVQVPTPLPSPPCSGIIWSNNSCGYDVVFMVLYSIWQSDSLRWCESFVNSGQYG